VIISKPPNTRIVLSPRGVFQGDGQHSSTASRGGTGERGMMSIFFVVIQWFHELKCASEFVLKFFKLKFVLALRTNIIFALHALSQSHPWAVGRSSSTPLAFLLSGACGTWGNFFSRIVARWREACESWRIFGLQMIIIII
jgi:hypothetical protein